VAWRRKGDVDKAVADFSEAIRLDPQYPAAHTSRGQAYEAKGRRDLARTDYLTVVGLPVKYGNGKWAADTARARLAVLGTPAAAMLPLPAPAPAPPSSARPTVAPPSAPPPRPAATMARRVALVLGNGAYRARPLQNPVNDARAMAGALRQIGFQVVDGYDLDYGAMRRVISDFLLKVSSAQVAVVYYAGHGLQLDGRNYLVPIDAKLEDKRTAGFELFDMDQILTPLDDPGRSNVVFLDACRNNPFASQTATTRALDGPAGLSSYTSVSSGMYIAFATAPGKVAEDGTGAHSPFTTALLKHLPTPKIALHDMFRRVRKDVITETKGSQIPWVQESLIGDVYMVEDANRASAN
jgi:hypothetical protein